MRNSESWVYDKQGNLKSIYPPLKTDKEKKPKIRKIYQFSDKSKDFLKSKEIKDSSEIIGFCAVLCIVIVTFTTVGVLIQGL